MVENVDESLERELEVIVALWLEIVADEEMSALLVDDGSELSDEEDRLEISVRE